MKRGVLHAKSLHVLRRLLGPIVALYISRCRAKADVLREAPLYQAPSLDALKAFALFSKWPDLALREWLLHGVMVVHRKGTCIGFAGEPPQTAHVYWVLSGEVTQVPTKSELCECAGELPRLPPNAPKTGPAVLPSYFLEDAAKGVLHALTPTQGRIVESLAKYKAGCLVDAEGLLLGGGRQRSLRCKADAVMLSFPFSRLLRIVQCLPIPVRSRAMDVARSVAQSAMAQLADKPSALSLISANPVLQGLSLRALQTLRLQMQPLVFLQFEVICHNVANSDKVFFLNYGRVLIEDSRGCFSTITSKASTAVGLETLVPCRLPDYYDQKLRAKAVAYSEMWYIPTAALLAVCDAALQLRCAQTATQLVGSCTNRLALASSLRVCPCFAGISEAAIAAVAKALQARVHCAGDTIVSSKRSPNAGILVVAGVVCAHSDRAKAAQFLSAGEARYFCECFVKMRLEESVVSQSSSIVLHGSPARIFESMELNAAWDDIKIMLDRAQEYVNGKYGTGASDLSKAQNAASERVRARKRRCAEALPPVSPSNPSISATSALTLLENELLVSLAWHLQALHPDSADEAKFGLFREGQRTIEDNDAPGGSLPTAECFSLDEEGKLVICTSPALAAPAHPLTETSVAPSPAVVAAKANAVAASLHQEEKRKERAAVTQAAAAVAPRSLRAAVCAPIHEEGKRGRTPSSRLTALRAEAARLRDEADGLDRRKEYQRQVLRAKHSL
ncbi:hypothetical protein LSCM1_04807 [Leishmania martiniquensis]|uniref:Cyclic nucleotide-binding domain-containing protein n=1 Tax=Leishmania martiniquensis TaxID=1580590 RepID=A0A836HS88_9TRYP|nr:hypothetical protein LSCM1_04807 [Leishmania martiniquensis]